MPSRVLITGAGRGFGAALSEVFAERGATVFAGVHDARTGLEPIARRYPSLVIPVELDVARTDSVAEAARRVSARSDALDLVINNAAIRSATVENPIETIDFEDAARTFEVNTIGPLRVVQMFLPLLRKGTSPMLVNVSSEAGSIEAPVEVSDEMMAGVVSLPHGWGHNLEGTRQRVALKHPGVNANAIIDELDLDEPSASTVLNGVKVQVVPIGATLGSL